MAGSLNALAELFRAKAKELGLNTKELATKSGVDYRLVLRTMKGESLPHEYSATKLADALGIPEDTWRQAAVMSRATRISSQLTPVSRYLEAFIAEHQYIRPPAMSQTNRDVRLMISDVYVSLNAEAETDRRTRDEQELRLKLSEKDGGAGTNEEAAVVVDDAATRGRGDILLERALPRVVELASVFADNLVAVILGHPGAGKTTLLKFAGVAHAAALQMDARNATDSSGRTYGPARLPVYVRVAQYAESGTGKGILGFIGTSGGGALPSEAADVFLEFWKDGKALVLLDGLDEITDKATRSEVNAAIIEFANECRKSGNQLIVSSRIHGYAMSPLESVPEFAVREMNREQVELFFRSWCVAVERAIRTSRADAVGERRAESILRAIDSNAGVRSMAVNPLLCVLIALIQQANVVLPERRVALMQKAVEALLRVWRLSQTGEGVETAGTCTISAEEEAHILLPLALWLHQTKSAGIASEQELVDQIADRLAAMRGRAPGFGEGREVEEFLGRIRNHSGILVERDKGYYAFLHLQFEEYFAGLQIVDDPDGSIEFVKAHRHQARWEEPIRLGIAYLGKGYAARIIRKGILESPSELENILCRDLCFAARCLGDCEAADPALARDLANRIADALLDPKLGVEIRSLREVLVSSAHALMMHAASASTFESRLFEALNDKDAAIRYAAVEALGRVGAGSADALRALLEALKDEDGRVRRCAAEALGRVGAGSADALRALLEALKDEDDRVRRCAAEALGRVGAGSADVLRALLKALKDEDGRVRMGAAEALGRVGAGSPDALRALLEALKDEQGFVRRVAAEALGAVGAGSADALRALLEALKDKDGDVRMAAAEALGAVGGASADALRGLLKALKDEDDRVRWTAAEALGRVGAGSADALRGLLKALKDEDDGVRSVAAEALGRVGAGSADALRALLEALKDEQGFVRRAAAQALGRVGAGSADALRALLEALKDKDGDVRMAAAKALGAVGGASADALRALLEALKDEQGFVRRVAAEALGRVGAGSADALRALLKALKDEDDRVRWTAADALGRVGAGSADALRALLEAFQSAAGVSRNALWVAIRDYCRHV